MATESDFDHYDTIAKELLVIRIGAATDTYYAVPALSVLEVATVNEFVEIPLQHKFIIGITNFRGTPVAVVSLEKMMAKQPNLNSQGQVLMLDTAKGTVGFAISSAEDVVIENAKDISPMPDVHADIKSGVAYFLKSDKYGLVAVLSIDKLLALIGPRSLKVKG